MNSFSQPDFTSQDFSQLEFPEDDVSEELAKSKPVSARGRGKGKKRSLVRPSSMPNIANSMFGSFDITPEFKPYQFNVPQQPSQAKRSAVPLSRRRTLANIEEARSVRSEDDQDELAGWEAEQRVAEWSDQLARLEESSGLLASQTFPQIVLKKLCQVWTNSKADSESNQARIASIKQTLQHRLDLSVASSADLERKYRELEDLEEEYRAVRTRECSSRKERK